MGKIPQLQSDQTQVPHACRTLFNMSRDDEPNFGPCLRNGHVPQSEPRKYKELMVANGSFIDRAPPLSTDHSLTAVKSRLQFQAVTKNPTQASHCRWVVPTTIVDKRSDCIGKRYNRDRIGQSQGP